MHTKHAHHHTHHQKDPTATPSGPIGPLTTTKAAAAPGDKAVKVPPVENIRLCAYRKWERAGKPSGDGIQFWLEAERELVQGK